MAYDGLNPSFLNHFNQQSGANLQQYTPGFAARSQGNNAGKQNAAMGQLNPLNSTTPQPPKRMNPMAGVNKGVLGVKNMLGEGDLAQMGTNDAQMKQIMSFTKKLQEREAWFEQMGIPFSDDMIQARQLIDTMNGGGAGLNQAAQPTIPAIGQQPFQGY